MLNGIGKTIERKAVKIAGWIARRIFTEEQVEKIYRNYYWRFVAKRKRREELMNYLGSELTQLVEQLKRVPHNKLIFFAPAVDWHIPLYQRPQHIFSRLAQNGYVVVFNNDRFNDKDQLWDYAPENSNIILARKDLWLLIAEHIKHGIAFVSSTSYLDLHELLNVLGTGKKSLVYDYIDEICPEITKNTVDVARRRHEWLKPRKVDAVLCSATLLYEEMISRGFPHSKVHLLENGVDYNHFHVARRIDRVDPDFRSIIKKEKPIIGYHGALASWLDYEILIRAANMRPDWEFVLIGIDYDGSLKKFINSLPDNMHYLGHVPYSQLPWYVSWFDVGIIPFKPGRIARTTSPIKLFEYMAAGVPPVCTSEMIECLRYRSVLSASNDPHDLVLKIEKALSLKKNRQYVELLDKEARENSWEKRVEKLKSILETLKPKSSLARLLRV